jgi:hypothetical protein
LFFVRGGLLVTLEIDMINSLSISPSANFSFSPAPIVSALTLNRPTKLVGFAEGDIYPQISVNKKA